VPLTKLSKEELTVLLGFLRADRLAVNYCTCY